MKKRIIMVWMSCLLLSLQGMAQQVLPQDVAGDKEYARVLCEYEWKTENRLQLLENYLKQYPDSRYANRVKALMASCHYDDGKYTEAIGLFRSCHIETLPDTERDNSLMKLALCYLKTDDLQEASVWLVMLQNLSSTHQADALYYLAYIDYVEKRYDEAYQSFNALKDDVQYGSLVPYYIAEIHFLKKDYEQAKRVAVEFLERYDGHKDEAEMKRIAGEAHYGMQNYLEAIPLLEGYMAEVSSPTQKSLYDLGMSYFHVEAYTQASGTLGKVVDADSVLFQNACLHRGLACLQLKERNQARMAFEQASMSNANLQVKEQSLYNYALCIHETSYSPFAESVIVFERFLNEFPRSPYTEKINDYLVEVYMNTRSYEAALNSIAKIRQPGARIMEAKQKILFRLGTQAFANADFHQAIQFFNRSLETGSYSRQVKAEAHFWRGEAYYRLDNYQAASADFRQYLQGGVDKSKQEYGLALYNLGYTGFQQKKYAEALDWFSRYVSGEAKESRMRSDAYNRMGDCHFYARSFDNAVQCYAKAFATDASLGDYSLYQEGFVKGLQRDYNGKIQAMNRLITEYPNSPYLDEALYEQGRAFVQLEDNGNAIERFHLLAERFPESHMARRALNETGLLYYQDDKYPEAIVAYKKVIQQYPGSEEARVAQRDLKSIYIDLNQIDAYADFASTLPGEANFDVNERDSLTYIAAERIYMRGEIDEAYKSLVRYLQTFPNGAFGLKANYHLGLIDYNRKDYANAATYLDKVLEYPSNKYSEEAMMMSAEMAYHAEDYKKSLTLYKALREKVLMPERKQAADAGMLRSAWRTGNSEETIWATTEILSDAKKSLELETEAYYYRSKVLESQGRLQEAMNDWSVLAKDTRNIYGAEAKYLLAQSLFDTGKIAEAEQQVIDYIEVSTPHTYWLARSFVLLADVYKQMGRNLDARQYLLSLKQNYQADDDISGMIEKRLKVLDEANKQ